MFDETGANEKANTEEIGGTNVHQGPALMEDCRRGGCQQMQLLEESDINGTICSPANEGIEFIRIRF